MFFSFFINPCIVCHCQSSKIQNSLISMITSNSESIEFFINRPSEDMQKWQTLPKSFVLFLLIADCFAGPIVTSVTVNQEVQDSQT